MIKAYNSNNHKIRSNRFILFITIISICYAIIRYNVFGSVPWEEVPIFVLNKGLSLASFILLTATYALYPLKNLTFNISDETLKMRKRIGISGFIFAAAHVLLSFSILNPTYYTLFFKTDGHLSLEGNLSLLFGIIGFVFLWIYNSKFSSKLTLNVKSKSFISSKKFVLSILLFIGIHLFFIGYKGWGNFAGWPQGLPPITLISFIAFALGFVINILGRK